MKHSPWITHVKATARKQNISYREALKVASSTYTSKKKTPQKGKGLMEQPIVIFKKIIKGISRSELLKLGESLPFIGYDAHHRAILAEFTSRPQNAP